MWRVVRRSLSSTGLAAPGLYTVAGPPRAAHISSINVAHSRASRKFLDKYSPKRSEEFDMVAAF
jgi:hypothetical protein